MPTKSVAPPRGGYPQKFNPPPGQAPLTYHPAPPSTASMGSSGGGTLGKLDFKDLLAVLGAMGVAAPVMKFGGGAKPAPLELGKDLDSRLGAMPDDDATVAMAEGGVVPDDEENDPSDMPEDIKELVEQVHKAERESRPDENWRITPPEKEPPIAPYKENEDAEDDMPELMGDLDDGAPQKFAEGGQVKPDDSTGSRIADKIRQYVMAKGGMGGSDVRDYQQAFDVDSSTAPYAGNFDDGGPIPDYPNSDLAALAPAGMGVVAPSPAAPPPVQPTPQPIIQAPTAAPAAPKAVPQPITPRAAAVPAAAAAPALTDQDFVDRANKMLGLNPNQQAGFLKMLGDRSQKAQIGAGIAGIGDAIASGGTLGKVNPGALARSEDLIQGKEKAGIEGMQTIRGNQEKATDLAQKLQAQDPNSPLSKYAQKAYGSIGKKLGIDLSHASASLIGDVAGKGVDALNTEYQNQLKMMGLGLQKEQVEATKANQEGERALRAQEIAATTANQKAERALAQQQHQGEAAKTLGGRGFWSTVMGAVPFTAGHQATKVLEREAGGAPESTGPVKVNSQADYDALPAGTHYIDSYGTQKVKK